MTKNQFKNEAQMQINCRKSIKNEDNLNIKDIK